MPHSSLRRAGFAVLLFSAILPGSTASAGPIDFTVAVDGGVRYDYSTGLSLPVSDQFTIAASLTMADTYVSNFSTPGNINVVFRNMFSNGALEETPWTESLRSVGPSALAPISSYGFARRSFLAPDYPHEESIYLEMFETGDGGFSYFQSLQIVRIPSHERTPGLAPFDEQSLQEFLADAANGDGFLTIQYSEAGFYRTYDQATQSMTWGPGYRYSAPASIVLTSVTDVPTPVPEPASILLLGSGAACLLTSVRRRRQAR